MKNTITTRLGRGPRAWTFALMLLGGCAAQSNVETSSRESFDVRNYRTLVVEVEPQNDEERNIRYANEVGASIVTTLRKQGRFDRVSLRNATTHDAFDLQLLVKPKDRYFADAGQSLVGGLAGRSQFTVDVELKDTASGRELVTGTVKGVAASKVTIFSASSMSQAIEQLAAGVKDLVLGGQR